MDENLKVGPRDPFDGRTFEERTQPSPPEVTEEDVREWTSWVLAGLSEPEVDYHDATDRLLTDRAQDKERIGELEGRLGPRSRAIHNRFAETEEHSGWWEACQVPPCRDDRTLLGEAQDE